MKTVAFDTSTKFLSIACFDGDEVKASFHEDIGMGHSERLIPEIKKIIKKLDWDIKEVGLVCVGLGPGSFTGIRIAVSAAKGLAAVLTCKLTGVPTMDVIADNASSLDGLVAPFMDARKDKVYTCIYRSSEGKLNKISDYMLVDADEFLKEIKEPILLIGDGAEKYRKLLDAYDLARYDISMDWYPKATDVGRRGIGMREFIPPEDLEPLYLHPKECNITQSKKI
ncbi:MAG: tRNA (adenosine(37)-N6)-threonylcarbamoyltransferase complex dimerization subunit type 1 TsaB [Candidatus Aadella gelida]|nr:tRNA (adenosine(37)-N6)-threonylcarbamoyltransferase complex dimerization subunit type 1 TsaB [Candidatus Aadella gelida]